MTQVDKKTKKTKTIKSEVGSIYLADLFNLTDRRIQQLTKNGKEDSEDEKAIFFPLSNKRPYKFDLENSVKVYVQYLQDQIKGKQNKLENLKKEGEKLDVDVELKQVKLKAEKLKLAEIEGNMHRSEDVQYLTADLILTIRSMLNALPQRLADDLVGIEKAEDAQKKLTDEVETILFQLAKYKYNPKKYKELVNERNKQALENDEDEEDTD